MVNTDKIQKKYNFWWSFFEKPRRILSSKFASKPLEITTKEIEKDKKKYAGELVITGARDISMLLDVIEVDDELFWLELYYGVNPKHRLRHYPYNLYFTRLIKLLSPYDYWKLAADWHRNDMTLEKGLEVARNAGYDV